MTDSIRIRLSKSNIDLEGPEYQDLIARVRHHERDDDAARALSERRAGGGTVVFTPDEKVVVADVMEE